jgi:hypothetical protein
MALPDSMRGPVFIAPPVADLGKTQDTEEYFKCPITLEVMHDPVFLPDGVTYERDAVEQWLKENHTSPVTREPMTMRRSIDNRSLREAIEMRHPGWTYERATARRVPGGAKGMSCLPLSVAPGGRGHFEGLVLVESVKRDVAGCTPSRVMLRTRETDAWTLLCEFAPGETGMKSVSPGRRLCDPNLKLKGEGEVLVTAIGESLHSEFEFPGELQLMEEDDVDAILPWPGVLPPRGLRPTGGLTAQPRVYPWIGDLLPWPM